MRPKPHSIQTRQFSTAHESSSWVWCFTITTRTTIRIRSFTPIIRTVTNTTRIINMIQILELQSIRTGSRPGKQTNVRVAQLHLQRSRGEDKALLGYGVMVTQQILVLFFLVRVRVAQLHLPFASCVFNAKRAITFSVITLVYAKKLINYTYYSV